VQNQLGSSTLTGGAGTQSVSVAVNAGDQIYVWPTVSTTLRHLRLAHYLGLSSEAQAVFRLLTYLQRPTREIGKVRLSPHETGEGSISH